MTYKDNISRNEVKSNTGNNIMNKSEKFWDRMSKNFDRVNKTNNDFYQKAFEITKKYFSNNDTVLDYGCATGLVSFEIAKYVKKVYGIDISNKMIEMAKSKVNELKVNNVNFIHTNIFDSKLKIGTFDAVITFNVLQYVENILQVIEKINNLLKPDGLFISAIPSFNDKEPFFIKIMLLLSKLGILPYVRFFKLSEKKNQISNQHFKIIEINKITYPKVSYDFIIAKKL